ncbi:hypothetical protein [Dactylosporangium sp. NPDC005555]|uniref:hypothetical protein n=1 Tax=Dactylosporangium sp. NPDC005555 TaxID=3154889 RepID=UPI0033BE148E
MTGSEDLSWLRHRAPVRPAAADDLSWIRHRRLPAAAAATRTAPAAPAARPAQTAPAAPATPATQTARPAPAAPVAPATSLDLPAPGTPPAPAGTPLDLSGGGSTSLDLSDSAPPAPVSSSLDLSESAPPPPAGAHGGTSLDLSPGAPAPPAPHGGTSLDLGGGPTPPPAQGGGSTSLDLFGEPAPPPRTPAPATPAASAPAAARAFTPPRTHASAPTVLGPRHPSVVLTRLQSGIGALTFEAAWSPDEGFALGCAYQLDSGASSVLRPGETYGPLAMDRRAGHQRLSLDLLHGRHLRRLIIFGTPTVDPGPYWAGTLLISTHGHARIEVPVQPPPPGPTVLLSLYNVDGEIVLRAEAQTVQGRSRDACLAFGYDRIAWRDADTAIPPAA